MTAQSKKRRTIRALVAFALSIEALTTGIVWSQETGRLLVAVKDAKTGAPLPLVRVTISGNAVLIGYSDVTGSVQFEDIPPGVYSGTAAKAGYITIDIPSFEAHPGQELAVSVTLRPVGALKTIAAVTVRSRAIGAANTVQSSSAARTLAGSFNQALNMLPGVQGPTDEFGPGSSLGVSIDGQNSTDTGFSFEGLPLGSLGGAGSLRGINTDLFAGAAVERSPKNGAQGGTINFFGFNPTIAWQESIEAAYGSYDSHRAIVTARGSAGRLGLAAIHSYRFSSSPLNDEFYGDSSGLRYIHDAAADSDGTYLRARYPFSPDHVATATMISENSRQPYTCFYFTGPVPCGYGPGNYSTTHSADVMLNDSFALHNATVSIAALVNTERFIDDDRQRRIAGTFSPFYQNSSAITRGLSVSAQLPQGRRHSVSFNASDYLSSVQLESPFAGTYPAFSQSAFVRYASASVSDSYHPDGKTLIAGALGVNQANGPGTSPFATLTVQRSVGSNDTASGSYEAGTLAALSQPLGQVLDPPSLLFNCPARVGLGAAGGTGQSSQSNSSARLAWQHRFGESNVVVDVYRHAMQGEPFTVLVNGNALPLSAFPPNYFADANALFSSQAGCGRPAALTPADLYFYDSVAGINRVYEGLHATATLALGSHFTVQPSYTINSARISGAPASILRSGSDITIGGQIPGVPLHSETLLADYRMGQGAELLSAMQHVDTNNQNNLPAYTTVSLAARIDIQRGAVITSVTNLFNQDAGKFITNYGVPIRSSNGMRIPTFAIPLAPRTFSLTYHVQIGSGVIAAAAPPTAPEEQQFSFNPQPLPSSAPTQAFALNTGSPTCTPELAAIARVQLSTLSKYADGIEKTRAGSGYPQTYAPARTGAISAFYHPFASSYALEVEFNLSDPAGQRAFGSVLSCANVAFGTREEIIAHGGYLPAVATPGKSYLIYQPSLGLYLYLNQQQTAQSRLKLFALPAEPPTHPFAIDNARCLSEFRPLAEQLLASLAAYVAAYRATGAATPQASGWRITPHTAPAGVWLELSPTDPYGIQAVESCAHVSQGTGAQIHARGLDAQNGIDLNFAPELGIYARADSAPQL